MISNSVASACKPEEEVEEETEDVIANPQTQDDEEDNRVFRRYKWNRHQYDLIIGSIKESGHTRFPAYSDYHNTHETKSFDIECGELDALYLSIVERGYHVNLSGDICARIGRRCLMNEEIRYLWVKLYHLAGDQINGFFRHWDGRDSQLLGLELMAPNMGDSVGLGGVGMGISRFLHGNRTLKELHLNHMKMNLDNARDLAATLSNESTTIPLVRIGLSGNEFGDEGVRLLSESLSKIPTIEKVNFSGNGLSEFSSVAPLLIYDQSFCVTVLNLEINDVDDAFCAQFATAIASNSRLKEVDLSGNDQITENGWKSIFDVVQNTASIDALCSSNHTLTSIGFNEDFGSPIENMQGPNCLKLIKALDTNSKHSSDMDTARRKIWLNYFYDGGVPLNELIDLDSKIMPFVLSMFACRKKYHPCTVYANKNRHRILYRLVKHVPSLFAQPSPEKVRFMKLMEEKDQIIENLTLELEKVKMERDAIYTGTSKRSRTDD